MDKSSRFTGALVVIVLIMWTINRIGETASGQMTLWSACAAAGQLSIGCMAIASVWRDRL